MNDFILVTWCSEEMGKQIMRKEHVRSVETDDDGNARVEWNYGKGGITGNVKESIEEIFKMMGE
jgi:hypothetical protein